MIPAHVILEKARATLFSGVIWVQEGAVCTFARGFGHAQRAESLPNRIDTRFGIASGAKTFTAVAIGRLVDAGKLTFDTRLRDCLDVDFPHAAPDVTLHQLLSHTSGMPDYFDEAVMDDYEALWRARPCYALRRPADFLPLFREQPMMFAPGERFHYNNGAFIVLGLVVEQATGLPFAEYVTREVLAPAGMADSGYFALDRLPERVALGYIEDDAGWRTNTYAIPAVGGADGGLFTTAPDVARFWHALLGGDLLSSEVMARMLTAHTRADDSDGYGYGLWIAGPEDAPVYAMSGEDPGAAFHSSYHPERDLIITLLSNTDQPAIWTLHEEIADYLATRHA